MTDLHPAQPTPSGIVPFGHLARFRRIALAAQRRRVGDEDGARKALGNDPQMPVALLAGASLEHLARIALG